MELAGGFDGGPLELPKAIHDPLTPQVYRFTWLGSFLSGASMFRKFWSDDRGNFAITTAVMSIPLLGALALGVDFSEMTRQRALALSSLDAAGIAAARFYLEGANRNDTLRYAKDFFQANANGIDTSQSNFQLILPDDIGGGGFLTIKSDFTFKPYFLDVFAHLMSLDKSNLRIKAETKVRLKNTLEVALVLDNSGSMSDKGSGSGKKRIDLLKDAAKQLVAKLGNEGAQLKQVDKPVQFSIVPFAASVNVGAQNAGASWMDVDGRSPVHHENFDWAAMPSDRKVQAFGGIYYKVGTGWGPAAGQKVTRLSLLADMKRVTGQAWVADMQYVCTSYRTNGTCRTYGWVDKGGYVPTYGSYATWQGCVEVRPSPFGFDDTAASTSNSSTLFVPMFAPDETDQTSGGSASNSYWPDNTSSTSSSTRQKYGLKYFMPADVAIAAPGEGPNYSCTSAPITSLQDVSKSAGLTTITNSINAMQPLGGTNVTEGIVWGWRTLSHAQPFSEGRSEVEKGNDKVVVVITDGANTYYTPQSLGYGDAASNRSIYSSYGFVASTQPGTTTPRIFAGTSVNKGNFANANYTSAMTQHMGFACENAKAKGIIIMTVALDLSMSKSDELGQINALKACSSASRFRKNSDGSAAKLFWNSTGSSLEQTFREIGDELSNLRIVH